MKRYNETPFVAVLLYFIANLTGHTFALNSFMLLAYLCCTENAIHTECNSMYLLNVYQACCLSSADM